MISNDKETQQFVNELFEGISTEFQYREENNIYTTQLPNKLQLVEDEQLGMLHGHPIKWILSGNSGIHAFIIGTLTNLYKLEDIHSEQNFYPPILTHTLASLGSEYIYSQIAIVIIQEDAPEKTLNWLNNWRDDPRYFRKIIFSTSKNERLKLVAKQIVENVLFPWNSIKLSSKLTEVDFSDIFNDEEEEE